MKRLISLLLTLSLCTGLFSGCGQKQSGEGDTQPSQWPDAIRIELSDGGVQEATYTYNEQGLLATLACTGAGEETLTYEYNVYGDVEKEASVNPFGESVTKYNYTYSYTVG